MYSRGATILEISMGMMILLPAFVVVVGIAAYLTTIKSAKNIALEVTRSIDMPMLVTTLGSQDAFVNASKLVWEEALPQLARKVYRQMNNFSIPNGAKKAVVFVVFDIPVNAQTGVARTESLRISWDERKNMDGERPTIISHGDPELIGNDQIERTILPVKRLVDSMRTEYLTTKFGQPFRFAVPSGLREVEQVAYFGSSHIYRPFHNYDNTEAWSNLETKSNYLRKAPVLAVTVQIDLSQTKTGKLLLGISKLGCSIIGASNNCRITTPEFLRVGQTRFIEPRNIL
jgi:hypothetical protein